MYSTSMGPALFIDGKNTAYRALFASINNPDFHKTHPFVTWLRLTNICIERFRPSSIHVFWDCPKGMVWRKKIISEYKENRNGNSNDEILEGLRKVEAVASSILPLMNMRVYRKDTQEADDLIYSACRVIAPQKAVIISSDSDMIQIPWLMSHVKVYDPRKNEFMAVPDTNPVYVKCLMGDSTDNVSGYRGIGDVKSRQIAKGYRVMTEFLDVRGEQEFKRNLALIDLSLNPSRMSNELYVIRTMGVDTQFDRAAITTKIQELKIMGLNGEFQRLVVPLKFIGAKPGDSAENIE